MRISVGRTSAVLVLRLGTYPSARTGSKEGNYVFYIKVVGIKENKVVNFIKDLTKGGTVSERLLKTVISDSEEGIKLKVFLSTSSNYPPS